MATFFSKQQSTNKQEAIQDPNQLTGPELDFLLRTLKTCTLKGEQVEMFYNMVIKLQNQYLDNQPK
jgi:hypothetical protein